MMLHCLGSSSHGNCYLLESESECLVLECGIPFKAVKQALTFDVLKIVGVVASHSHKDHFGYAEEYLKCGFPVYASEETHGSISRKYENQIAVKCGYWYQVGDFNITPFRVEHDVECFGYVISHKDTGNIIFATDTSFVRNSFRSIQPSHLLVECNYSIDIINQLYAEGTLERSRLDRLLKTHMEINTTKDFIVANQTSNLDSVCLLHLSDNHSDAVAFKQIIQDTVKKNVNVYIAENGLSYSLDLFPF